MGNCQGKIDCDHDRYSLGLAYEFEADPDIAGIGVLLSLLVSGWLSFAILVVAYFNAPSRQPSRFDNQAWILMPARISRQYATSHAGKEADKKQLAPTDFTALPGPVESATLLALKSSVMTFSDQQLAVGLALLSVAYIQHCDITQYHFEIVFWLAWGSFAIHQMAAQVLTDFLRQPSPNVLRAWLIFSFWPLLSTASVIVNNDRHMEVMGFSTQCVFNDSSRITTFEGWLTVIVEQMILAWGVLDTLGSYSSRALCLSAKAQLMVDWLARIPTRALISFQSTTNAKRSKLKELRDIWTSLPWASRTTPSLVLMRAQLVTGACFLLQFSLWAVFWPVFALYEISLSNIVDMWRVFGTLLMATWAIVNLKRLSASSGEMQGNENEWGFGQLLPVLLLILPILSVMQTLEDSKDHTAGASPEVDEAESRSSSDRTVALPVTPSTTSRADTATPVDELAPFSSDKDDANASSVSSNHGSTLDSLQYRARRIDTEARLGFNDDGQGAKRAERELLKHEVRELEEWAYTQPVFQLVVAAFLICLFLYPIFVMAYGVRLPLV